MKDFIICMLGLAMAAVLIIVPIVFAFLLSPSWLCCEIFTAPFALVFFFGSLSI
jgi:hypothetical protein